MRLPDFIIIGGQKCGTTSLHQYLQQHPDIAMSKWKELQFFADPKVWDRGLKWYASNFEFSEALTGEASPQYSWQPFAAEAPKRMHSVVPGAKLIYIVRDPIDRVLSQYSDYLHQSWEELELDVLIRNFAKRPNLYLEPSRYYSQIEAYLKYYKAESLRVWTMEDLSAEPLRVMKEIFAYLGVDSSFTSDDWTRPRNPQQGKRRPHALVRMLMTKGARPERWVRERFPAFMEQPLVRLIHRTGTPIERPQLNPEQEAIMLDIFRDDVRKLRDYTGLTLANWRDY